MTSNFALDAATIRVLWWRDIVRFFREKSRVIGAFLQPLIFWIVIGSGMNATFRLSTASGLSYLTFFFPGTVTMVVLFTAIFTTMSVIEDRSAGFLQSVLVGPGSRVSLVLGKCAGASTVALIQALLFVALGPFAGFQYQVIDWPLLMTTLVGISFALSAVGFSVAWLVDSTAGYHVVMSVVLLPSWILSGAMFPLPKVPWVETALRINPMSYAVSAIRQAMHGDRAPDGTIFTSQNGWLDAGIVVALAVVAIAIAGVVCSRKK